MKSYYTQDKISSSFRNFFSNIFPLSKPHLNLISFIITAMISAESVVSSDMARKLKDNFSLVNLEYIERRFRRFFQSFSSISYHFYDAFIRFIISKYSIKHPYNSVHISFDHMFCKNKFTILLFSLRIGKQGLPIWFRCFKGKFSPDAFSLNLIKSGISYCANLFLPFNYHIIFLADRWFPSVDLLSHIQALGCFYCIRSKSDYSFFYYNSKVFLKSAHIKDIKPKKYSSKVLSNVFFTFSRFPTNIVVSNFSNTNDVWYILTNNHPSRAIRNYSYRFGSIECIFKSQKSNGFRLESTNT